MKRLDAPMLVTGIASACISSHFWKNAVEKTDSTSIQQGMFAMLIRWLSPLAFLLCAAPANAASWYEDMEFNCVAPLPGVRQGVATWLTRDLPVTYTSVAQGKAFATLSYKTFASAAINKGDVWDAVAVDTAKAADLKKFVSGAAHDVPVAINLISGWMQGWALGRAAKPVTALQAYLVDKSSDKIGADALVYVIADGAVLGRILEAKRNDAKQAMLAERLVYTVQIGRETRAINLAVCVYPLRIRFERLQTVGQMNNKALVATGDKKWTVIDVDTGKQEGAYAEHEDDGEYIYVERLDGLGKGDRLRVSMWGGAYQGRQGDKWVTFYARTSAQ
jgi:hypothetical protein